MPKKNNFMGGKAGDDQLDDEGGLDYGQEGNENETTGYEGQREDLTTEQAEDLLGDDMNGEPAMMQQNEYDEEEDLLI